MLRLPIEAGDVFLDDNLLDDKALTYPCDRIYQ
jgi:hypothetical protein